MGENIINDFFASIYESIWGYKEIFYDYLFDFSLFCWVGIYFSLFTILVFLLFYYLPTSHPRFNRYWAWLITVFVLAFINFFVSFIWVSQSFYANSIEIEGTNFTNFGLETAGLSVILFILLTFIARWWSINCSKTPIPL